MIRLLFVGDGERDAVTVPRLVETLLDATVGEEPHHWAHLHQAGRGYNRKLLYAFRVALDCGMHGLVATVDCDKERKGVRLKRLRAARDKDRGGSQVFPAALGEAVPHGEAWLLDDPVAVRESLQLPEDVRIPTMKSEKNPKAALHQLIDQSPRHAERPIELLADIASGVDPDRCGHAEATGFDAFAKDVESELGSLASPGGAVPDGTT